MIPPAPETSSLILRMLLLPRSMIGPGAGRPSRPISLLPPWFTARSSGRTTFSPCLSRSSSASLRQLSRSSSSFSRTLSEASPSRCPPAMRATFATSPPRTTFWTLPLSKRPFAALRESPTFAPPRIAILGSLTLCTLPRALSSFSMSLPAIIGMSSARPTRVAWDLWAAAKASFTKKSPISESLLTRYVASSSFLGLPERTTSSE